MTEALPLTAAQVRAIHVARKARGIDRETYLAMLDDGWGASSCKDLDRRQASELLRRLGLPLAPPRPKATPPERLPAGVTRMVTEAQRRLIGELCADLGLTGRAYRGWLRRNQGLERVRTSAEARRVIDGLMAWRRRRRESLRAASD